MRSFLATLALALALLLGACSSSDPGPSLDGDWVLAGATFDGQVVTPPTGQLDLRITGDQLSGSAGCNNMGGTADIGDDGSFEIRELFSTEMACFEPGLMEFESRMLAAMHAVESWEQSNDRLTLRGGDVVLEYTPRVAPPDAPLVDTAWILDTFFDGDAAMNSVDMADVTLIFGDDSVSAVGRCWTIAAPATIEPGGAGNLRVDVEAADPEFRCDDRALFADMSERLTEVNTYEIAENRLTLSRGDDPLLALHR